MKKTAPKELINSRFAAPLILLVICVLAYGLMIPSLGYYWDDWPYAWSNHVFGPGGYPDYVALDRPYSAWIFMGLATVFGEQPLGYHISALLLYWACAVLFWWLIKIVWTNHDREAFWAALLFAIYPGFLGHPQGIIYNHHFAAMALYLFSLVGMIKALRSPKERPLWKTILIWWLPSVVALLISQFTIEYFIGWEVVRVGLAWIVIRDLKSQDSNHSWSRWLTLLPYWLVTFIFLYWRVFIFQFPTYQPYFWEQDIVVKDWLVHILTQIFNADLYSWRYAFPKLSRGKFSYWFWGVYLILWIASSVLAFWILRLRNGNKQIREDKNAKTPARFGLQTLGVAVLGSMFAGAPFWLTGLTLDIGSQFSSRFTLAFIPWAALLLTSGFYFISKIRLKIIKTAIAVMMAVLVGGSTAWHFWNANVYRNDWIEVQGYFQQLVQRIPGLEPGTSLVINDMRSISLYQDDSLTAILNWTYAPDFSGREMPYIMQYLSVRIGDEIPALQPGLPIEHDYRSLNFSGSTDKVIAVYYQSGGCVRVLDESDGLFLPNGFPEEMKGVLPLSNLTLIQTQVDTPATPPLHLFDLEGPDTWCQTFEKADLASQMGDWDQVVTLGDDARKQSLKAGDPSEMFVFLEGYLRAGQIETALEVSREMSIESEGLLDDEICTLWTLIQAETGIELSPGLDLYCQP